MMKFCIIDLHKECKLLKKQRTFFKYKLCYLVLKTLGYFILKLLSGSTFKY